MNTEVLTCIYQIVSKDVLIALRNDLLLRLRAASSAMQFRLFSDNDFCRVLDELDPELPCAAKDIEEALRAFDLGLRFLS